MIGLPVSSLARPFRRAALPLAAYYAVTLVVPMFNGTSDAFLTHAPIVLFIPIVIVESAAVVGSVIRKTSLALQAGKAAYASCGPHQIQTTKPLRGGTKPTKEWDSTQRLRELRARSQAFVVSKASAALRSTPGT